MLAVLVLCLDVNTRSSDWNDQPTVCKENFFFFRAFSATLRRTLTIGASKSKRFVFISLGKDYRVLSCFQTMFSVTWSHFKAYKISLLNYPKEQSSEILLMIQVKYLRSVFFQLQWSPNRLLLLLKDPEHCEYRVVGSHSSPLAPQLSLVRGALPMFELVERQPSHFSNPDILKLTPGEAVPWDRAKGMLVPLVFWKLCRIAWWLLVCSSSAWSLIWSS